MHNARFFQGSLGFPQENLKGKKSGQGVGTLDRCNTEQMLGVISIQWFTGR